jgi:hypothetical protein
MFRHLRLSRKTQQDAPAPDVWSATQLAQDSTSAILLRQLNILPEDARTRLYRALLPPDLLIRFGIDPITWKGSSGARHVELLARADPGEAHLVVKKDIHAPDDTIRIELSDNRFSRIELSLLLLNDPDSPLFRTDIDAENQPTLFGTARRNLAEEERAMQAGLAPAQMRAGLGASRVLLDHLETFLAGLGQRAYYLEPLTYVSAWLFERRGFAYLSGHKLMDDIHKEFQRDGRLRNALDGSTPFRQSGQWRTVRGRAWAIHDGILDAIDARWNDVRMVKQIGKHAQVETFPDAEY